MPRENQRSDSPIEMALWHRLPAVGSGGAVSAAVSCILLNPYAYRFGLGVLVQYFVAHFAAPA